MSDWAVGDLAVCVDGDCGGGHSPGEHCSVGRVYAVIGIRLGPFPNCRAPVALRFAEFPHNYLGHCCARFRKIRPDEREACEPEFVTLLKRSKVPEPAHGYDDFLRGGVPGVEGRLQTRLGTWVRVGKVKGKK